MIKFQECKQSKVKDLCDSIGKSGIGVDPYHLSVFLQKIIIFSLD